MFRNSSVAHLNKSSNALVVEDDSSDDEELDCKKENFGGCMEGKQRPTSFWLNSLGLLNNDPAPTAAAADIIEHHLHNRKYSRDGDSDGGGDDNDDDDSGGGGGDKCRDDGGFVDDDSSDGVSLRRELDLLLGRKGLAWNDTRHKQPSRKQHRLLGRCLTETRRDDNARGRLASSRGEGGKPLPLPTAATALKAGRNREEETGNKVKGELRGGRRRRKNKVRVDGVVMLAEEEEEETGKGKQATRTNAGSTRGRKDVAAPTGTGGAEEDGGPEEGPSRQVTATTKKTPVTTTPGHSLPSIDERLSQLRPSRELLEFYRKKIAEYNEEHTVILTHVDTYRGTYEEMNKLQWEIRQREAEIVALQTALSDTQVYFYKEKDHVLRLYAENDRLKLRELEDKQKIQHLLSLGGYPEGGVTYFHKEPPAMAIIEQRYSKNVDNTTAVRTGNPGNKKKSCVVKCQCENEHRRHEENKILSLQIDNLQAQLEEQASHSKDYIAALFADRHTKQVEVDSRRKRDERKIEVLVEKLQKSQELLYDTTKQFLQQRYSQRTNERGWMAEKDELLQRLDKLQEWTRHHCHHATTTTTTTHRKTAATSATGVIIPLMKDEAGTRHRCSKPGLHDACSGHATAAQRRVDVGVDVCGVDTEYAENKDQELFEEIQNLRFELQQTKTLSEMYRSQAIEGEEELCKIREEGDFAKDSFKDRSQKMSKRLQLMNTRYQELEKRRHFEVEGFKNDIKNLRTRLKEVERELYKVTLGLTEELDEKDPDNLDLRILRNVHLSTNRSHKIMSELKRLKSNVYSLENDLRHL